MSTSSSRPPAPRRGLTLVRVVVLALVAILASGTLGSASASTRQVALGVSMLQDRSWDAYRGFITDTGRAPAVWSFWSDWGGAQKSWLPPADLLASMRAWGTVPLIIWQPVDPTRLRSHDYTYQKIASGKWDWYIKKFAKQVHAYGGKVLIRFAHEFDGDWFPWGVLGRNRLSGNSPDTFKKAWKRIWNIFRGKGSGKGLARNARFIWSPLGCDCNTRMNSLWPGSQYVDYLGMTAFNWGKYHNVRWQSLDSIVATRLKGFRDLPKGKPVILTEVGSHYAGGNKADWIANGYGRVYSRYPRVKAVLYFNVDMRQANDPGHIENWLLTMPSDESALNAYRKLLTQTRFKGRI